MDPALTTALVVLTFSGVSAFIGYWSGYGNAERAGRERNLQLKARIHELNVFNIDLAAYIYSLRGYRRTETVLTPLEAAEFAQLTEQFREDTA